MTIVTAKKFYTGGVLQLIVELGNRVVAITSEEQVLILTTISEFLRKGELNLAWCAFDGDVI